jgi:hypothetical protein
MNESRMGVTVLQKRGYQVYVSKSLPPDPPLHLMMNSPHLSYADRALARLEGMTTVLPNADLFVAMYVEVQSWHAIPWQ